MGYEWDRFMHTLLMIGFYYFRRYLACDLIRTIFRFRMSIESKVENFFKGLVSQIPPAHKRSKSTVNGGNKEDGEEEKNGSHERGRKDSVRKVKTRSSSKNPQKKEASKPTSPVLQHVDDFPVNILHIL
jgi:hypothetical protein